MSRIANGGNSRQTGLCARWTRLGTLILALTLGTASAQFSAPAVRIGTRPAGPALEVATSALIQPKRIEVRLNNGYSTANVTFSVFSAVAAELRIEASDPRLVVRGGAQPRFTVEANTLQSVSMIATAPHKGIIRVINSRDEVIAEAPYEIAAPKLLNQNASVSYSPRSNQLSLGYSVSMVPQSIFDPRLSASANLSLNATTGEVGGSVSINVGW